MIDHEALQQQYRTKFLAHTKPIREAAIRRKQAMIESQDAIMKASAEVILRNQVKVED